MIWGGDSSRAARLSLAAGLGLLLGACAADNPGITDPAASVPVVSGYHDPAQLKILAPGSRLRLVAFEAEELSGDLTVDAEGRIALGSLGKVHVAGLTVPQAEEAIARHLRARGMDAARVTVMLIEG